MKFRPLISWLLLVAACGISVVLALQILSEHFKTILRDIVRTEIQAALEQDATHFSREQHRIAARETAQLVSKEMKNARAFPDRTALLEYSIQAADAKPGAIFCEFGVYTGATINFIASKTSNTVHGFDSFEGLPDTWRPGFEKGTFELSNLPMVRPNVKLHKGWFNQSLPGWAKDNPGPIAFMHMDADLYASTKDVFDILGDRIVVGTVIQFDEYFNYPGWKEHEYKAFMEFVERRGVKFEYLGYVNGRVDQLYELPNFNPEQASVRILAIDPPRN